MGLKERKRRLPPILIKSGMMIVSILFTLVIMEAGIRIGGIWPRVTYEDRDYFSPSSIPGVPYTLKPAIHATWAKTSITTNAIGIRSAKDYGEKQEGLFRILTIGDSITFGMGVEQDKTYPAQLEKLLNRYKKSEKKYEVINGGISGFSAVDEANFIAYLNDHYHPDLVIWMLIANDYDDSLGVNEKGQMTYDIPSYAATSSWLERTWGLTGPTINPDNFLSCMGPRQQCWALGKPMPETKVGFSALDAYLDQTSCLYSLVSSRIKGALQIRRLSRPAVASDSNGLVRYGGVQLDDGSVDILPEISSIFISPFYKKRFYDAIRKGIQSTSDRKIPLLILSFNVEIEKELLCDQEKVWIEDICEYLGMPSSRFWLKYNLGWDPHLNGKGNSILAYGIMRLLSDKKLFVSEHFEKEKIDRRKYWRQYRNRIDIFEENIDSYIDFEHFKNIHQIVGGLYPPRTFPIRQSSKLSIILKNTGKKVLRISGSNFGKHQDISVRFYDGISDMEIDLDVPPGNFSLNASPSEAINFKNKVIDVQIQCVQNTNPYGSIKFDYIGYDQ